MAFCDGPQTCSSEECLTLVGREGEKPVDLSFMVAPKPQAATSTQAPQTFNDRSEAVAQRLKLSRPGGQPPVGSDISSEYIRNLEEKGNKSSGKKASADVGTLPVQWSYVRHKTGKVDRSLGKGSHLFHPSDTVNTVLEHVRKHGNIGWTKGPQSELELSELSLQLNGGYSLDPGTSSMRLDEFIQFYSKKPDAYTKFLLPPARTRGAPNTNTPRDILRSIFTTICHIEDSEASAQAGKSQIKKGGKGKGKTREDSSMLAPSLSQMRRSSGSISGFRSYWPGSHRRGITTSTELEFKKVVSVVDPASGEANLRAFKEPFIGQLSDTHFAHGEMKLAYKLIVNGVNGGSPMFYAAKRLYRMEESTSTSEAPVTTYLDGFSVEDQNRAMQYECLRSGTAIHLLEEFYKYASELGVTGSIYKYLQVAECFLALEKGLSPSPASGISFFEDGDECSRSIMWAVEAYRSTSATVVQRFSGTLRHNTPNADLLSLTIYAYVHFVYWYTEGEIVLADVQGTPGRVRDNDGFILFDLMTHSTNGGSGIGDFGKKSINTFLRDHQCKDICRKLQLPDISLEPDIDATPSPERRRSARVKATVQSKTKSCEEQIKGGGSVGKALESDDDDEVAGLL